jgi:hypothetical protein
MNQEMSVFVLCVCQIERERGEREIIEQENGSHSISELREAGSYKNCRVETFCSISLYYYICKFSHLTPEIHIKINTNPLKHHSY